jgi:hypothetical protein
MPEITLNLHMHTIHSDGSGTYQEIADAAIKAGLDAVIVTDHNKLVLDQEGYYSSGEDTVLVLVGEEIHDPRRDPQKNHLLVFGVSRELADEAEDPQKLIRTVTKNKGLCFLAHPTDPAAPIFNQGDFSWVNWEVSGFTGIEVWNGFSEFKTLLQSKAAAIWYSYLPKLIGRGPLPETLAIWDRLMAGGKKVVAVGGSDAHALPGRLGPLRKTVFPYLYHFQAVNTHLLLPQPLSGDLQTDKGLIYGALREGHGFVGYDLPHPTRGFRFTATGKGTEAVMGDEIRFGEGITLQITLPKMAECILIKDGMKIKTWTKRQACSYGVKEAGVFRVEAYLPYQGLRRGWIFSNPIYVRD